MDKVSKGLSLTDHIHTTYKLLFASLSSSTWGNRKPANASPKYRGSTWRARRELKGMTYSTLFPSARTSSGWDLVCYRNYRGRNFGVVFCWVRICVANPHHDQLSFSIQYGWSRQFYASHVTPPSTQSVFPIHNSIGRAFSCTVTLELSNPPFSYAVLANFSLQLENHRAVRFASKRLFISTRKAFLYVQSLAVKADATASHRDPACQLK